MSEGWTPRLQAKAYDQVLDAARRARAAGRMLSRIDAPVRDKALHAVADALEARADDVLAANEADLQVAALLDEGALDRLRVTGEGLAHQAGTFRRLAEQSDPLGEQPSTAEGRAIGGGAAEREATENGAATDGMRLTRLRVPLGVLGVVYEARPITALEVVGPALRAGNAILLRGAPAAVHTDEALVAVLHGALEDAGLPVDTVALLPSRERSSIRYLVSAVGLIDLVVVRGGTRLVASALADAKVPALRLSSGNCHVYVHADADQQQAVDIVLDSKADPSAPHAVEAVLVHAAVAPKFVPLLVEAAGRAGLRVHADERTLHLAPGIAAATNDGWVNGYRSADLAVGVVGSLDDAIEIIDRYGQGHTEVIVTRSEGAAQAFLAGVDAAVVSVNLPTTVSETMVFATQKLHVRGSVTAADLTTTRWVARAMFTSPG